MTTRRTVKHYGKWVCATVQDGVLETLDIIRGTHIINILSITELEQLEQECHEMAQILKEETDNVP